MAETIQQNVEVGARAKQLRKARRLTQPKVAERVGVTLRAYQAWEAGENAISWTHLEKLAPILETSPEFLLHGEDAPLDHVNASTQLQRIEDTLVKVHEAVKQQAMALAELETAVAALRSSGRAGASGKAKQPRRQADQ